MENQRSNYTGQSLPRCIPDLPGCFRLCYATSTPLHTALLQQYNSRPHPDSQLKIAAKKPFQAVSQILGIQSSYWHSVIVKQYISIKTIIGLLRNINSLISNSRILVEYSLQ